MRYLEFRHNVHSANGEDGIIKKIFSDLNITEGIVCEFGAANGLDDSNTAALWKQNFQAVLIESDSGRFDGLKNNTSEYDVECIHTMVRGGRKKGIKDASFNVEKDSNEYNDDTWMKEREREDAEQEEQMGIAAAKGGLIPPKSGKTPHGDKGLASLADYDMTNTEFINGRY